MLRSLSAGILCLLATGAQAQTGPTPITGATCVSTGTVVVTNTIVITAGTYDGGCRTYVPGPGMDANSHSESVAAKSVLFRVENGAKLRNVIVDVSPLTYYAAARAVDVYAGAMLENVKVAKVQGDVAVSIKSAGFVGITKFTAADSADRIINAAGVNTRVEVSNCVIRNARKVFRQDGGTIYPTLASLTLCDLSGMTDEVFRTDSPAAVARLTNSRLHAVKKVCTGYAADRCIQSGNVVY